MDNGLKNQRICQDLVGREVVQNVSMLVHHFAQNPGSLDGSSYSQDEIMDLCRRPANPKETLEENGYKIVVDSDGDGFVMSNDDAQKVSNLISFNIDEYESLAEARSELIAELGTMLDEPDGYEQACDEMGIDLLENASEVYEHWIVSDYFAEKLKEHGETVGELFNLTIWGRCTTGQAISMDGVIEAIANDMEILAGQKYDWSAKEEPAAS